MLHVRYRMKTMLRQKTLLFWSLAFPIILGMLFYFMFGGINDLEQFEEVPVGVLTNSDLPEMFVSMMEEVQTENKIPLFRVKKYTDGESAAGRKDIRNRSGRRGVIPYRQNIGQLQQSDQDISGSVPREYRLDRGYRQEGSGQGGRSCAGSGGRNTGADQGDSVKRNRQGSIRSVFLCIDRHDLSDRHNGWNAQWQ